MTQNMRVDRRIEIFKQTPYPAGIRSIDWNPKTDSFIVGTRGAEIYEVDSDEKVKCLMRGHYNGEVWGCAVHPTE